ncbi:hypothetical protein BDN72DRAFT_153378 [Pluteus cervinus]|uniref:Uncharacterized protein n=1 Tax=Pluteus cervinus TaxID=181527 RepID=A0ACD3AKX0_9AGAR|nr:hypothetical protein BDN72DRAFT_153378 [Pluteus cervinus]
MKPHPKDTVKTTGSTSMRSSWILTSPRSRTTKGPGDFASVLPTEIWTLIFSYLPAAELERLKLVHRACYELARAQTWKTLQLAYFDTVGGPPNRMVKGCIKDPVLAGQVRHLLIQERSVFQRSLTMTSSVSLWVKNHTILPVKRSQRMWKSKDGLVDESLRVISHLTERLNEMTINFYWPPYAQRPSQHRLAFYEQLFTLLAHGTLQPNPLTQRTPPFRFRSLILKVQLHHLPLIANWFRKSPRIFDELERLSLGIGVTNRNSPLSYLPPSDDETIERDTRAVVSQLRKTFLQCVGILPQAHLP